MQKHLIGLSLIIGLAGGLASATAGAELLAAASDLSSAFIYPNPCNVANDGASVTFTNLSSSCTIRIFNSGGELVKTIAVSGGTGETTWNLVNNTGGNTGGGIYFYIIESGSDKKMGKLIIIR